MMRREFMTLIGAAAAAYPIATIAQDRRSPRRIGVLLIGRSQDSEAGEWLDALSQHLDRRGWGDGRLVMDVRKGDLDRGQTLAAQLIASRPDLVIAVANPSVAALRQETRTVPIVFALVGDPVGSGFVSSLARPGGNITGFMHFEPGIGGKWLELLKELAPATTRVRVLALPEVKANLEFFQAARAAAAVNNLSVDLAPVRDSRDIEHAVADLATFPDGGLIILPNPVTGTNRAVIGELTIRYRIPAIGAFPYVASNGALAAYGISILEIFRQVAEYTDRILRGEKPGDLPVQVPTKYALLINLKTAKALGLDISATLLARADEVIE